MPTTVKKTRLHLGASALEQLVGTPTEQLIDPSWIHLGDLPNFTQRSETGSVFSAAKTALKKAIRGTRLLPPEGKANLYSRTEFRAWVFTKGDALPFPENQFSFAFSEHVFEHFRFDVACDLLRECHRVLDSGGVLRVVVPDADYRTYELPEPAGFPSRRLQFNHPNKHKIRWNVYLLATTLDFLGFDAIPISWCDDQGNHRQTDVSRLYHGSDCDKQYTATLAYIQRPQSLIVDGLKKR